MTFVKAVKGVCVISFSLMCKTPGFIADYTRLLGDFRDFFLSLWRAKCEIASNPGQTNSIVFLGTYLLLQFF